jgi:putative FmdB family regulatory protein
MPLYDYVCEDGHIVEVMHGVNASGPAKCERCGAEMRKLLSTPAIVFKGSGWAKKDRSTKPATKDKPATDSEAKPSTTNDGQSSKSDTDSTAARPAGSGSSKSASGADD